MQNLDQLRAAHALDQAKHTDKSAVSKLPAMILTNGLLGTLAFSAEEGKDKRAKMLAAVTSLTKHLAHSLPELAGLSTPVSLAAKLAGGDAITLQRATTEALAYFGYLKRYAPKKPDAE